MRLKIFIAITVLSVIACRDFQVVDVEPTVAQSPEPTVTETPEPIATRETSQDTIWMYEPYYGNQVKRYCADVETQDIENQCPVIFANDDEIDYLERGRTYRVYAERENAQGEVWLALTTDLTVWVASTNNDVRYGRYYVIQGDH